MFEETGGDAGQWGDAFARIADSYFRSRTASSPPVVRWQPYGNEGQQYAVGADGQLITRGKPAASPALVSLLPLALIAGLVVLAIRVLK